jgi:hypothetical protein
LHTGDPLWWTLNTHINFYSYHLYPHERSTSTEMDYGIAVDVLARYGRMAGVAFLGESTGDQFHFYPEPDERPLFARDIIWFSILNGNPGVFFWDTGDYEISQFRIARQILSEMDFTTFKRARPEVAVDVSHPLDHDKFYRTEAGSQAYAMMGRYARSALESGVDFDFVTGGSGYAVTRSLAEFKPLDGAGKPLVRVQPPYQVKVMAREGHREVMVYLRNAAEVREWRTDKPHKWVQWLRKRAAADLKAEFNLPLPDYVLKRFNLNTGEVSERRVAGSSPLAIPNSQHDYVLLLRAGQ